MKSWWLDLLKGRSVKENKENSPGAIYQRIWRETRESRATRAKFGAAQSRKCKWRMMFDRLKWVIKFLICKIICFVVICSADGCGELANSMLLLVNLVKSFRLWKTFFEFKKSKFWSLKSCIKYLNRSIEYNKYIQVCWNAKMYQWFLISV